VHVPSLQCERVIVRPLELDDLGDIHRILDIELGEVDAGARPQARALGLPTIPQDERRRWLEWTVLGYEEFARLHQPPYGERAVVLKTTERLIGACGFVPCLDAFEQLPFLRTGPGRPAAVHATPEVGLFYAIAPAYQRQGYASEAARALVDFAFTRLRLKRIVATTTRDNVGSMGVMRRLGMRIDENPLPDPPWLQVVGILENRQGHDTGDGGIAQGIRN
jgi:ribosomal-protein-alanine N-acetyltransferase